MKDTVRILEGQIIQTERTTELMETKAARESTLITWGAFVLVVITTIAWLASCH